MTLLSLQSSNNVVKTFDESTCTNIQKSKKRSLYSTSVLLLLFFQHEWANASLKIERDDRRNRFQVLCEKIRELLSTSCRFCYESVIVKTAGACKSRGIEVASSEWFKPSRFTNHEKIAVAVRSTGDPDELGAKGKALAYCRKLNGSAAADHRRQRSKIVRM